MIYVATHDQANGYKLWECDEANARGAIAVCLIATSHTVDIQITNNSNG